ncbi:hypothetical protein L210DRAFT_3507631 [Boletus edulis BED1]|uniref:Uncharacterized protein n=1 Tax=Boletus edulis BED1 TaxID=1328754 RepID=A0AAD4BJL8_BOLED|nr:hypothetical protein L210DRAFT_3507631 [Boletus edulis BED1]
MCPSSQWCTLPGAFSNNTATYTLCNSITLEHLIKFMHQAAALDELAKHHIHNNSNNWWYTRILQLQLPDLLDISSTNETQEPNLRDPNKLKNKIEQGLSYQTIWCCDRYDNGFDLGHFFLGNIHTGANLSPQPAIAKHKCNLYQPKEEWEDLLEKLKAWRKATYNDDNI